MTTATATATATPTAIDTALAEILGRRAQAARLVDSALESLHLAVGDDKAAAYRYGPRYWKLTDAEVVAKAEAGEFAGVYARRGSSYLADYRAALDSVAALDAEAAPFEAEFTARGGWTRAYLATSKDGHIHASRACGTCRATTTFYWFVELSGHDEAEIVAKAGSDACTACYPSAPVHDLKRPRSIFSDDEIAAQAAREEREAAKAERAAKKLAKALLPTGEKCALPNAYGRMTDVTTLAAAKKFLTDDYEGARYGHQRAPEATIDMLAHAIAAKEGKTAEAVLAEAEGRAAKRRR